MFRLERGRSYLWWFPIFGTAFLGGFVVCEFLGGRPWAVLTLPAFVVFLLGCELRSGVALDSWWRASYAKGTWQYRALIAWHVISLILFVGLSYLFIAGIAGQPAESPHARGRDVFEPIDIPGLLAFAMMFSLAIVWLGLVWWLFRRLRRHHPATYELIGSPTLFWNNTPRLNLQFVRFLFSSQWRQLPDPALVNLCLVMRVFLCIYVILFLAVIVLFMRGAFAVH